MPFVTRFHIQRLTDTNATEFYTIFASQDDWTRDDMDAVEFSSRKSAQRRADLVGGEVCEFSRPATAYEAMMLARSTPPHSIHEAA
jgi:hypothetical protein